MNHRGAVGFINLYSSCILTVPWSSKWFTGLSRVNPGIPLLSKRFQRIKMKFSGIIKYYHASKMLKFNSNVSSVYTLRQFLDFVQGVFQKSLKIEIFCVYAFIILIWTKGWNFTFVTSGLHRKSFKIFEFFVWTSNVYDVCSVYYAKYGTEIRLKIGQCIIEISGSKNVSRNYGSAF